MNRLQHQGGFSDVDTASHKIVQHPESLARKSSQAHSAGRRSDVVKEGRGLRIFRQWCRRPPPGFLPVASESCDDLRLGFVFAGSSVDALRQRLEHGPASGLPAQPGAAVAYASESQGLVDDLDLALDRPRPVVVRCEFVISEDAGGFGRFGLGYWSGSSIVRPARSGRVWSFGLSFHPGAERWRVAQAGDSRGTCFEKLHNIYYGKL